jgi:hypothetical protein
MKAVDMSVAESGKTSDLETRLGLISQMLEQAVELLRSTMTEVRQEANNAIDDSGPDRWAR